MNAFISNAIDVPSVKTILFQDMWRELGSLGELPSDFGVLCPMCLLPKSFEELTLEHIIPERALKHDPVHLKRLHSVGHRAGLTLTCKTCNALKGRYYDPVIEALFRAPNPVLNPALKKLALKARRVLGYLAAFRERGYSYILSESLDSLRVDFLDPQKPADIRGVNFVTVCFQRFYPHAYFDGWCDTFDAAGNRTNSVFECFDKPGSDTVQVRTRHLTVTIPVGRRVISVPSRPFASPNISIDMSRT